MGIRRRREKKPMFGRHTTQDMVTEEVDPTDRTGVRTRAPGDTLTYDGEEELGFDVKGKMREIWMKEA
jgi:hypothetical protein